jgi:hypothetical protein
MHSQLFTNDPKVSGWTYGFWEMRLNNQSMIGHGGDTILFQTLLELLPEHDLGIFVSFNEQASEPAGGELLQTFYGSLLSGSAFTCAQTHPWL